jgi:hypothetical protein
MQYLHFNQDVLIFTDKNRSVGCVIDDSRHPKGHPVTSGFLRLLEDALFDPGRTLTPAYDELQRIGLDPQDEARNLAGLDSFLETSRSIGWTPGAQQMGDLTMEEFTDDTVLSLDGNAVWCPAGVLATRTVGSSVVRLAVSPMDLHGSVQPDQRILASPVSEAGPDLRIVADASCGVCGVCGVCAICAEINAATPAGAISAVTALSEMQDLLDPADRRALIEGAAQTAYASDRNTARVDIA